LAPFQYPLLHVSAWLDLASLPARSLILIRCANRYKQYAVSTLAHKLHYLLEFVLGYI